MPTALSVNLNKIALIRNSRGRDYPDLKQFAAMALNNGAVGITIHPRPDQRHARYDDIHQLKSMLSDYPGRELNIEGNPQARFLEQVLKAQPHQCTLVPDADNQITSDHGYDLTKSANQLAPIIEQLKKAGIRVSVFMDPQPEQMKLAASVGADRVELYTESWAEAYGTDQQESVLALYRESVLAAKKAGLGINAGHDLNLDNLEAFLAIGHIDEVSIGHALTVEALIQGFEPVIARYVAICQAAE